MQLWKAVLDNKGLKMKTISVIFFLVIATFTYAQELKPAMDIKLKGIRLEIFRLNLFFARKENY